MLPPGVSTVTLEHLAESQLTGSQPQGGELSLAGGSDMLLSEMLQRRCGLGNCVDMVFRWNLFCERLKSQFPFLKSASAAIGCQLPFAFCCRMRLRPSARKSTRDICSKNHPRTPCKFWNKSYGAVPDAVLRTPINDDILHKEFMVWPEAGVG